MTRLQSGQLENTLTTLKKDPPHSNEVQCFLFEPLLLVTRIKEVRKKFHKIGKKQNDEELIKGLQVFRSSRLLVTCEHSYGHSVLDNKRDMSIGIAIR